MLWEFLKTIETIAHDESIKKLNAKLSDLHRDGILTTVTYNHDILKYSY